MLKCNLSLILIFSCVYVLSVEYHQERAVIKYHNTEYVPYAQAFTGRVSRGDPYTTNVTATIIHPWGNNVTFKIHYKVNGGGPDFVWKVKVCDIVKNIWLAEYYHKFTDIVLTCPLPPKNYNIYNMELPPKNFPFPLPKGETNLSLSYHLTENMAPLLEIFICLRTI